MYSTYIRSIFSYTGSPTIYVNSGSCIAAGFPLPNVDWYNDTTGNIITNGSRVYITEQAISQFTIISTLTLAELDPVDRGRLFHCGASNSEGSFSFSNFFTLECTYVHMCVGGPDSFQC